MKSSAWRAKWAAVYFAVVFGVGFALGPIRVLLLEPRLGVRAAELIEAPFMLLAIVLVARWLGGRMGPGVDSTDRVAIGAMAAGLVLAADVAVGIGLRGMSLAEVFTARDPVSGAAYYALVVLMALAPWLLGRQRRRA